MFVPEHDNRGGQWATVEAGCRVPTQTEVRNRTDTFYAIFPLAEQFFSFWVGRYFLPGADWGEKVARELLSDRPT